MPALKLINLEDGRPTAQLALSKMVRELATARREGYAAVKLIHGYGSSGPGGAIKTAVARDLQKRKALGLIRDYIPGQDWSIFNRAATDALAVCRELSRDRDLNRSNQGITIVLL